MSYLLTKTASESRTKSYQRERMKTLTFIFPSLRPPLLWILKVLWVHVITYWLKGNYGAFRDWYITQIVVFDSNSGNNSVSWSEAPSSFILAPVNVSNLFQLIIILDIFIAFDDCIDFRSHSFEFVWVFDEIVNDHGKEARSCICTWDYEGLELVK